MNQHSNAGLPGGRLRISLWFLGVCLLAGVMTLCLIPLKMPPAAPEFNDKVLHLAIFALLAGWFGALVTDARRWQLMLALMAYGLLIEVLQSFTAYRSAEWLDSLADGAGILLGWLLLRAGLVRWPQWLARGLRLSS